MQQEHLQIFGTAKILLSRLNSRVSARESQNIVRRLVEFVTEKPYYKLLLDPDTTFTPEQAKVWKSSADRLLNGEPLQYVIGETQFRSLIIHLERGVLIPRPETEELVEIALKHFRAQNQNRDYIYKVCDVGCGSGCIALSLAAEISGAQVTALDRSPVALSVTKNNAERLGLDLKVLACNILDDELPGEEYDLIISNPPYIPLSEAEEMEEHVLAHEPELALFVPDNDPLIFYRRIAELAADKLKRTGVLLFEIHEQTSAPLVTLLERIGYKNIEVHRDLQDKDRILSAKI